MNPFKNQRSWEVALLLIAVAAVLLAWSVTLHAVASESPFPVRVSANGHYLEDASGQPFLLHGDTAWSLIVQLTKEEAEEYLENRRQKGVNSIIVNLIEFKYADNAPKNRAGDAPFATPGNFSTPNEAYFAHADWVVSKAGEKGMLAVLNPCYTGNRPPGSSNLDGWANAIVASEPAICRNYGRYLGQRYKGFSNIIWQAGGDQMPPAGSTLEKNWLEILQGIKDIAPGGFWTAHWKNLTTALDNPAFAPNMSLDNVYTGNRAYIQTLRAYKRTNPRPTFLNEANYEGLGLASFSKPENESPQMMRAQAYWALLSGAAGHHFGSHYIWTFDWSGFHAKYRDKGWRAGMESQGSREMAIVKRLFEARAWQHLIPDQDHSVVTKGYGTFGEDDRSSGGDYVTAARTSDGKLVMAYVPSTNEGTRIFTVNMARLSSPANARWYNPTSGMFTAIEGSPLVNRGSREFTTPGDNGTGTNDWVFVLESAKGSNER